MLVFFCQQNIIELKHFLHYILEKEKKKQKGKACLFAMIELKIKEIVLL
jgi:hypothetical protein